ncbi:MAG: DUF167 family protein [Sulfurisoma sp.]|nr:DUF167 family protein [Sulfurisoma sp.]
MSWIKATKDGVVLALHIQPGAKKTEIVGLHGEALKIRLAAPPVDGKANDCLLAFLADRLGVAGSRLELLAGANSRAKRVKVGGGDTAIITARLGIERA